EEYLNRKTASFLKRRTELVDHSRVVVQDLKKPAVETAFDERVIALAVFLKSCAPGQASAGVPGHDMRRERSATERYHIAFVDEPVNRMLLAGRVKILRLLGIEAPDHHLRPGQFLHHVVTAHMVRVSMARDQDFDVGKLEP